MRHLLALAVLVALPAVAPAAQTVRDSVRMSISVYTWHVASGEYITCGAGVLATWPNVLQDVLGSETRTYGYRDYGRVATEGMYIPSGYGEDPGRAPEGSIAHNPQLNSWGSSPGDAPDCGKYYAAAAYRAGGGTGPLNARPFRVTDWYATFSIPSGTPIALFEWEPADGLAIDFDASFESEQSREVDADAPTGKRPVASYAWRFGDGDRGTGARPTHTYDEPGDYEVTLTVTDDDGEEATRTETVTVHAAHLTVQIDDATEEGVKGDTLTVRATVTNSGSEPIYGVRVPRDIARVPRVPDEIAHPSGQIWNLNVVPAALADGEEAHVFRARLDPGESVEILRDYVIDRPATFRIYGEETAFRPADMFVDWTEVAGIEGETPDADSVEVRQPCAERDARCATTLVTYRWVDVAVETSLLDAALRSRTQTSAVRSGLVVGPFPGRPTSNGQPTRVVAHRFDVDGGSRCRSGCINFAATMLDRDTGEPMAGLKVDVSHPAIDGPTVVTPGQGGGFVCDLAEETCGQRITLTANDDGVVEGLLAVPGVIRDTDVVLTVGVAATQPASYEGVVGTGEETVTVQPNVVASDPIPVDAAQARDLGAAAAIRAGFRRADLPNTLCGAIKDRYAKVAKVKLPWVGTPPKDLMKDLCGYVDAAGLGAILDVAQSAAQVPQMGWFFESTRLSDLGLAESRFKPTPPFFEASSQFVDELSTAIEGRLDADGDMAPGAAPFSIHEVSYLQSGRFGLSETNALYFRLWDHTALVENDYLASFWLRENHDRSLFPTTTPANLAPGDTELSTAGTGDGTPRLVLAADSLVAQPDSLYAGALVTLSPDDDARAETVRVLSATGTVADGQTAELATALRHAHPAGSPLRVVGAIAEGESLVPYALTPADTVVTDGVVRLSWGAFVPVQAVDVEVARDAAFADVVVSERVAGDATVDGGLDLATGGGGLALGTEYFWRARSRDRSGRSAWSEPARFVLRTRAVADEAGPEAPPEALALRVRPNPSSSRAVLTTALPAAGHLRVMLFDPLGRRVAVLADSDRPAGLHETPLDVGRLPAGVYLVRAEARGQAVTQSLTVVR